VTEKICEEKIESFGWSIEEKYTKHNKTHFYKYTDINTARLILQNKTWRWSSPSLFNDPFDTQSILCFDCEEDLFRETLCKEIEERK